MRIYRVSKYWGPESRRVWEHFGYSWHKSNRSAKRDAAEWRRFAGWGQNAEGMGGAVVESFDVDRSKDGLLHLLGNVAEHSHGEW